MVLADCTREYAGHAIYLLNPWVTCAERISTPQFQIHDHWQIFSHFISPGRRVRPGQFLLFLEGQLALFLAWVPEALKARQIIAQGALRLGERSLG